MKIETELITHIYDPEVFPGYGQADEPVCAKCFGDEDIRGYIHGFNGPPGCSFCGLSDAPTAPLDLVAEHMRACLTQFYGFAVNQLPYESKEGGYQGEHWNTFELLLEVLTLDLPREHDDILLSTLSDRITEELWCRYDWLSLDYDEELKFSWRQFCHKIQYERRFFFDLPQPMTDQEDQFSRIDREGFSPLELLYEIIRLAEEFDLIRALEAGTKFFRARPCVAGQPYQTAEQLGPPPAEKAVQANRMNPPGIPMMYSAETASIAGRETRSAFVTVGRFEIERDIRVLDLADLPEIPGIFSGVERRIRLGLIFFHAFSRKIARPVDRTDRINIEYIPSQVVTEFIRDTKVNGQPIEGIRYPSTFDQNIRNLVLFANQDDLKEPDGRPVSKSGYPPPVPWIRLLDAQEVDLSVS